MNEWVDCDQVNEWVDCDQVNEWVDCDQVNEWVDCDQVTEWVNCDQVNEWTMLGLVLYLRRKRNKSTIDPFFFKLKIIPGGSRSAVLPGRKGSEHQP